MRKVTGLLLLAGLAAPTLALSSTGAVGATSRATAAGTTCTKAAGTLTFNPPMPVSGPATLTITNKGTVGGCSGSVFTGTVTGSLKYPKKVDCAGLIAGTAGFASGTMIIKWNVAADAPSAIIVTGVKGPDTLHPSTKGVVHTGTFVGLHSTQTIAIGKLNPANGCTGAPLKSISYTQSKPLVIK